jgi:hypothetical protein
MTDPNLDVAGAPLSEREEREIIQLERFVQSRINAHLRALRPRLFRLHAVEAMAILGTLTLEAFQRLPQEERMQACASWTNAITSGVRDSLD